MFSVNHISMAMGTTIIAMGTIISAHNAVIACQRANSIDIEHEDKDRKKRSLAANHDDFAIAVKFLEEALQRIEAVRTRNARMAFLDTP